MDDFADLRSDYGLTLLNDYLAQFYPNKESHPHVKDLMPVPFPCQRLVFDESFEEKVGEIADESKRSDSSPRSSPNKRIRCEARNGVSPIAATERERVSASGEKKQEHWTVYREESNPERVLKDSLEESPSSSSSGSSSGQSPSSECVK